jgi:hypothetical protein
VKNRKSCHACDRHNQHMRNVWAGLIKVYQSELTEARRNRKTIECRRLERLINHYQKRMREAPSPCSYQKDHSRRNGAHR